MQLPLKQARVTRYGESICHKYSNSSSAFFPFPRVKFFHPHLLTLSLLGMFVFLASFLNFFHPAEECLIPSEMLKPRPSLLARRSVRIYRKQNKPSYTCMHFPHLETPHLGDLAPTLAWNTKRRPRHSAHLSEEGLAAGHLCWHRGHMVSPSLILIMLPTDVVTVLTSHACANELYWAINPGLLGTKPLLS